MLLTDFTPNPNFIVTLTLARYQTLIEWRVLGLVPVRLRTGTNPRPLATGATARAAVRRREGRRRAQRVPLPRGCISMY